jgi:hypothetical protein
MVKSILLIASVVCLMTPLSVVAEEHDEVTMRVLEMDEATPDSVINQIALPVIQDEYDPDGGMKTIDEQGSVDIDDAQGHEIDIKEFESDIEIENIQGGISTQVHGK